MAHVIDNDWNLKKKLKTFCPISSYKGKYIGKAIKICFHGWGIIDAFTVMVEIASDNDVEVEYLKS